MAATRWAKMTLVAKDSRSQVGTARSRDGDECK